MKPPLQDSTTQSALEPRAQKVPEFPTEAFTLPEPIQEAALSIDECLRKRRSVRDYSSEPVSLNQVSNLLWAALGVTAPGGLRTAPSAGAIYPLRPYLIAANVEGLAAGVYSFDPDDRTLKMLSKGDKRKRLAKVVGGQQCVEQCAAALLLMGWYRRITREFGDVGPRLAAVEAGHVGQNFCLQAVALGLGAIGVGKFDDTALRMLLRLPEDEEPIYMLLCGKP